MAGYSDDEDLVVYGTPIEREEDTSARKRWAVAESGQLRALPAWKQEVRDEEGRRRFHGAFTGGFSAGFYNTAGSKEGWTPQTFTSSRKNRAEVKKQSIHSFLDEDDVKDMGGNALETSQQYDTFGFTAAEYARKQASKEQKERPLAIPGPIPDELVIPTTNSIGVKLLTKMGWRQGRSIRDSHSDSLYESRRNARKAFIALSGVKNDEGEDQIDSDKPSLDQTVVGSFEEMRASRNTPVYVLHPKQDLHGLGYDPFKHAPEFRDRKKLQKSRDRDHKRNNVLTRGSLLISNSGHYAPGFGIGALEELDVEDEDIYASGFAYEQTEVDIEPSKTGDSNYKLDNRKRGVFLSFKIATNSDYKLERFHPPEIPVDFDGRHKFPTPVQPAEKFSDSAPPEVPPPEDTSLALLIEGCAAMVARCGKHIEDFYKKKSKTNPQFLFLSGGDGCNCYTRKLWEHQQKYIGQRRPVAAKSKPPSDKLTAENRGKILGERPLDRSTKLHSSSLSAREAVQLQSNLVDTFVKPISLDGLPESEKPFRNDPAKQARFEQFLRDKYQGGLRAANVTHISTMSDADRARERLDFEAAATAIEKGKEKKVIDPSSVLWLPGMNEQRFISATQLEGSVVPQDEKPIYPRREQFEWRPSPILCKRFDVVDPFMGKPMPIQRPRSKIDNLILMTESTKGTKDEVESSSRSSQHASVARITEAGSQGTANDPDIEHSSMQRHVDLYKAIFSDDSDDDTEEILNNQPVDPVKTSEGANMALNRLVAEDFLESLGKELGLEVPPERPDVLFRSETLSAAGASVSSKNEKITSVCMEVKENQSSLGMAEVGKANADAPLASAEKIYLRYEKQEHRTEESRSHPSHRQSKNCSPDSDSSSERHRSRNRRSHHYIRSGTPESDSSSEHHRSRRRKSHSRHRKGRSRTPDADSPSATQHDDRKRQKKRHHRTYTPDTDSSDHEYKERFKSSKDRSRKHSRHHKHGRKDHAE